MNYLYLAITISAWSSNPLLRRTFIDRVGDSADGASIFVLWNAVLCAVIALASTASSDKAWGLSVLQDASLCSILFATAFMGVLSTYLMNKMLASDNPGHVICIVSGTNNLVVYVLGSLFYGSFNRVGVLGVICLVLGITLISRSKQLASV